MRTRLKRRALDTLAIVVRVGRSMRRLRGTLPAPMPQFTGALPAMHRLPINPSTTAVGLDDPHDRLPELAAPALVLAAAAPDWLAIVRQADMENDPTTRNAEPAGRLTQEGIDHA